MGISLDDGELWEYLAAAHTGVLTTLRHDGWPVPLPTWFVVLDGAVLLRTPARARKVARIRDDARASFVVESGHAWSELRAAVLLGRAEIVDDAGLRQAAAEAMAAKYAGLGPPAVPQATRRHYGGGEAVIRFVATERVLSWDNARLRLPPVEQRAGRRG